MNAPNDYLEHLRTAGLTFTVAADLVREEDHDGPLLDAVSSPRRLHFRGTDVDEHFDAGAGLGADHATVSVAAALVRCAGELDGRRLVDLGCGTGVLAVLAARLGCEVIASDVDPAALALTVRNARANGVSIDCRRGSLLDPLADAGHVPWFVANLPHKPASRDDGLPLAQAGGPEGDSLFAAALPEMARRQHAGDRLLFFLHSLPHPRLLVDVGRHYDLELVSWKHRFLGEDEYGAAVRERFRARHREGLSYLHREMGREALVAGVWSATRREERPPR